MTSAASSSSAPRHLRTGKWVALGLLVASLGCLVFGLVQNRMIPLGTFTPAGLNRFLAFSAAFWGLVAGLACLGGTRRLLALLAVFTLWLASGFGIGALGAILVIGLACLSAGDLLLGPQWRARFGLLPAGLLTLCVGLVLLMLAIGLTSTFHIHFAGVYLSLFGVLIVAARRRLALYGLGLWHALVRVRTPLRIYFTFALLIFALAAQSVYAALPEQYHDALGVHLLVATTLAQTGAFNLDPAQFISAAFPHGANWLFAAAYLLAGESGAKASNFALLILLCAMLAFAVARRHGLGVGLLVAALLASTPLTFIETASLFSENALTVLFFAVALLLGLADPLRLRDAVGIGILLAGSLLVKLHAVVFIVPFGCVLTIILFRRLPLKRALAFLCIAAILTVLLGCQPYVNSYVLTGNPIFPWFNAIFKSPYFDSQSNFSNPLFVGRFTVTLLYDLTFHSRLFIEGLDGAFGFAMIAIIAPGLVLAVAQRDRLGLIAFLSGIGYCALLGISTQYLRYFYPALPLLLLTSAGALSLLSRASTMTRVPWTAMGFGTAITALNLSFLPTAGWILTTFDSNVYWSARERQELVEARVPYRALIRAVNAIGGAQARVLVVGQPVGAGLATMPIYSIWYNPKVSGELATASTPDRVSAVLQKNGISHVIWRPDATPAGSPLPEVLKRYGTVLAGKGDALLYRLEAKVGSGLELLANADFAAGLDNWSVSGFSPSNAGQGLTVPAGGVVAQATAVEPGEIVAYQAQFSCEAADGFVRPQINWLDRSGRILDVVIRPQRCEVGETASATFSIAAPAGAATAFVYFNVDPGGPIRLKRLALVKP